MDIKKLKEIINNNGFSIEEFGDDIEISQYTPCGEDWNELFNMKNVDDFVEDLECRTENFDINEEAEIFIPQRGHKGIPEDIQDILDDQKWKLSKLQNLLIEILNVLKK